MTFGFSRDDIGGFLPDYLDKKILAVDPFRVLDRDSVGELVKTDIESRVPWYTINDDLPQTTTEESGFLQRARDRKAKS